MSEPALFLAHLLFAYMVVGEPCLGVLFYRNLQARLAVAENARARYYKLLLVWEWTWVGVIALILLASAAPVAVLGLRPVNDIGWVIIGSIVAQVVTTVLFRVVPRMRGSLERQLAGAAALLPTGRTERWLYAAVAITAGICEELLYRGFAWFYLTTVFPDLPVLVAGIVVALVFGMAHAYQGKTGILQASLAGGAFLVLYLFTGSLVPSMIGHALADLRVLALPAPRAGFEKARAAR